MRSLSEALEYAVTSKDRFIVMYKDRSVVKGYVSLVKDQYYIAFNTRALVRTRLDVDSIRVIRFTKSRVKVFEGLGRY